MKDRRIKVSIGRTVQPKPFESIRVDVGFECTISDDADFNTEMSNVYSDVASTLDDFVDNEIDVFDGTDS